MKPLWKWLGMAALVSLFGTMAISVGAVAMGPGPVAFRTDGLPAVSVHRVPKHRGTMLPTVQGDRPQGVVITRQGAGR